jgi:cytochrome c553
MATITADAMDGLGIRRVSARAGLALALVLAACSQAERKSAPQLPRAIRFDATPGPQPGTSAALLRHGRRLAKVLGCQGCHGADLTGQPWEEEADLAISFSSNLSRAVPDYSDAALERAIRLGLRADGSELWGMPSEIFTRLEGVDMAALIAFLRSLRPAGRVQPRIVFGPRGRRQVARGEYRPAPRLAREGRDTLPARLDGSHDLARYMTRATCGECHGLALGGNQWPGESSPPDLVVAGTYTRREFRHLMRTGEPPGARRLGLMAQVARGRFAHLTDREVDAIYDYLVARAYAAH